MNLARSVADVLAEHVSFEVECIDRMYCNVYVPRLQYAGGLVGYVHQQLGLPIASTAPLAAITDRFVKQVHAFAQANHIRGWTSSRANARTTSWPSSWPVQRGTEGVVFIGRAQEKTNLFRTEKRRNADGHAYPWIVRSTGVVNHFYFYCLDADFGPFFLKFCSYFPYNAKLCLNGHHWAQRQAAQGGDRVHRDGQRVRVGRGRRGGLQAICDALGPAQIYALLDKWLQISAGPVHRRRPGRWLPLRRVDPAGRVLPDPDARRPGHRPDLLRTRHPRQPRHRPRRPGRADLRPPHPPRPEARPTPGRFRTRVITDGVTPSLHADYKHTTMKQYHKEGRALRTETTINDTWDFDIGKRLVNLPALREIGFSANRRLLGVQRLDHDPIAGTQHLHQITDPVTTKTGTRIPGLRLGQPRSHALLSALLIFRTQLDGFTNRDLRTLTGQLRGLDPATLTTGQTTYDLRRLRSHGLIERDPPQPPLPQSPTPVSTPRCCSPASTNELLPTGLAHQADPRPAQPAPRRSRHLPARPRHPRRTERTRSLNQDLTQNSGFAGSSPLVGRPDRPRAGRGAPEHPAAASCRGPAW